MKFKVYDAGINDFLNPEVNSVPFKISHDGCEVYTLELTHPDFILCKFVGKDKNGKDLYVGDIISSPYNRGPIEEDSKTGEFFVWDQAPFPCKRKIESVGKNYEWVGNVLTGYGPQTRLFEVDFFQPQKRTRGPFLSWFFNRL